MEIKHRRLKTFAVLIRVKDKRGGRRHDAWQEDDDMPYRTNADLPEPVKYHLPHHAQDIYREAFNHAFAAHVGDPRQEEAAHRIAWAAVKRIYVKAGNNWVRQH